MTKADKKRLKAAMKAHKRFLKFRRKFKDCPGPDDTLEYCRLAKKSFDLGQEYIRGGK